MQLGYGFVHVKEGTLLGYFADDLQQKGVRKRGGKMQGGPQRLAALPARQFYSDGHEVTGTLPLTTKRE